jgi:hypothetical protein
MCQTFRDQSVIKRDRSGAGHLRFDREEFAGSRGDLGTILPLGIGMIAINGLDPFFFFAFGGSCYLFPRVYFGVTMPVDPMKMIGVPHRHMDGSISDFCRHPGQGAFFLAV